MGVIQLNTVTIILYNAESKIRFMFHMITQKQKFFAKLIFPLLILLSQSITGQQRISITQYIDTWSPVAIEEMRRFGIPASIKLAQGILESDFGNSRLAVKANNHFGIKCHGWQGETYNKDDDARNECFRAYVNARESFSDHSVFLSTRPRYALLFELEIHDYKGWAKGLRSAGYATNPKYPELLIGIIERHDLARFDRMATGTVAEAATPLPRSASKATKTVESSREIFPVPLEGPRQVLTNNRIRYIRARPGDTPASLAKELEMREWQFTRYNDLDELHQIQAGQIIYLQPKRRRAAFPYHLVQQGETMYDISQKYGVRLGVLYRRNKLDEGTQPKVGSKIKLR